MDRCTDSKTCQQPLLSTPSTFAKAWFAAILFFVAQPLCIAEPEQQPIKAGQTQGPSLDQQRKLYQEAKSALRVKSQNHFNRALSQMGDYPLKHYLEAMELFEQLNSFPRYDVRTYLKQHDGTPIATRLRYRWLEKLRHRDRWQDYLLDYKHSTATTAQRCYYQHVRLRHGEPEEKTEAITAAIKLWTVGKSQPKGCDKLFNTLIKQKHITEDIAWQRYSRAILSHQYQLARYIKGFFKTPTYQELAERFYNIDRNHRLVGDYNFFSHHPHKINSEEIHSIITHGLRHLARVDAVTALTHWGRYRQTHPFSAAQTNQIITALVKGLYDQDHAASADIYLTDNIELIDPPLLEWRIRKAMRQANWQEVLQWIGKIPIELQQDDRWRYWAYRTKQLITTAESTTSAQAKTPDAANATYQLLSVDRSFYGFISSEWLGNDYSMAHRKTTVTPEQTTELAQRQSIIVTHELLHQEEYLYARREWRQATRNFSEQQWIVAAHLAQQWGWDNGSITSMIRAAYWDDIDLRFPLAFKKHFETNAQKTGVPLHLLYAVARQESALSHNVTSPAGAKGLMQLMPATAKQTAKKNGIRYQSSKDLFKPETNIKLGSSYYKEMLDRFGNNRILATAAYNAGPHRVDRWLKESDGKLPFDAWVETIPFKETRNYVQNVLAFSMIYAHHLKSDERILNEQEKSKLL